jgi:hypothetical protein
MIHLSNLAINSPVSYLIALLLPALDVIIPVLPSETAIITLGVATAGSTDPRIAILVLLAALGRRGRGARPGPCRRWTGTAPASSSSAGSSPAPGRP